MKDIYSLVYPNPLRKCSGTIRIQPSGLIEKGVWGRDVFFPI